MIQKIKGALFIAIGIFVVARRAMAETIDTVDIVKMILGLAIVGLGIWTLFRKTTK